MAGRKIQLKRGALASLPTLDIAEMAMTLDTGNEKLHIGSANGNIEIAKKVDLDTVGTNLATEVATRIADKADNAKQLTPINQSNTLFLSESILGSGTCIPQYQGLFSPSTTDVRSIFTGSHIATALAEMADDIYVPSVEENALKNSNDVTIAQTGGVGWVLDANVTASKVTLKDGTQWNLITKNATAAYNGFYHNGLRYPVGALGVFVSFELYIPLTSTPAPLQRIWASINNFTTGLGTLLYQFNPAGVFVPGKKYKLECFFPASGIVWTPGADEPIQLHFQINRNAGDVAGSFYIRNIEMSFFSTGHTRYVATGTTPVAAQAVSMQKEGKNNYNYKDIDTTIISYGRNEANDGVEAYSHYRAYDKLISQCIRRGQLTVVGNPPPYRNGLIYDTANDLYMNQADNRFDLYWLKLVAKWNCGVNVFQRFLDLVSAGTYTPTQLNTDAWHPTTAGGGEIATLYADKVKGRIITNNCLPELKNNVKYYIMGIATGTWTLENPADGVEARIMAGLNLCRVSSTLNDYLLFTAVEAKQLHIIFRQDASYGTFNIIIDEGLATQRLFSINSGVLVNRTHGQFVCDFLDDNLHTVKIIVTSTGLPVKIHGIVAI